MPIDTNGLKLKSPKISLRACTSPQFPPPMDLPVSAEIKGNTAATINKFSSVLQRLIPITEPLTMRLGAAAAPAVAICKI